jgi:NNP family nitrate/nitrite transporter-like MFS transporter
MIPLIFQSQAKRSATPGTPAYDAALGRATKESSAVIGIAGAIGALGGFLIPLTFGAPWIDDPAGAVTGAFVAFTCFYVVCLAVTWFFYTRRTFLATRAPSLASARI